MIDADSSHEIANANSFEELKRIISQMGASCGKVNQRGPVNIEGSSNGPMLTVTNNGTGDALLIDGDVTYGENASNAFVIEGTINAALATTDPEVEATVTKYTMGKNPGDTVTLINPASGHGGTDYVFYGDDDSWFLAYWYPEDKQYRIAQMECPA